VSFANTQADIYIAFAMEMRWITPGGAWHWKTYMVL
jgi:hypothetical protein